MKTQTVAVLGASPKADRYANKAIVKLLENGHTVLPINPFYEVIEELPVIKDINSVEGTVDTLTLYVGPGNIGKSIPGILKLKPGRVIMNPGTESDELIEALDGENIPWIKACTLVLLGTNQF